MPGSIYYRNRHLLQQSFAENFYTVIGLDHDQTTESLSRDVQRVSDISEQEFQEGMLQAGHIFENRQVPKPWRTAMAHVAGILTVRHALATDELREQTHLPQSLFDTATAMLAGPLPQQYTSARNSEQTVIIAPSEKNDWQYQSSELLCVLAEHAEEHFPSLYSTIELYSQISISDNS